MVVRLVLERDVHRLHGRDHADHGGQRAGDDGARAAVHRAGRARRCCGIDCRRAPGCAIVVAGGGIAWMYGSEVGGSDSATGSARWSRSCVPLAAAVNWTLIQAISRSRREAAPDMLPAVLIGALISAALTLPLSLPFAASAHDLALLALLGVVQLAIPCLIVGGVWRACWRRRRWRCSRCSRWCSASLWAWLGAGEASRRGGARRRLAGARCTGRQRGARVASPKHRVAMARRRSRLRTGCSRRPKRCAQRTRQQSGKRLVNMVAMRRNATTTTSDALKAPSALLLMLEGRAPWEFAALLASAPWLGRLPGGDGHPVLVLPRPRGRRLDDTAAAHLPAPARLRAVPWGQGMNGGRGPACSTRCADLVREIVERHGQPLSFIGWSLGGIYARETGQADAAPDALRRHARDAVQRSSACHAWMATVRVPQRPVGARPGVAGAHPHRATGADDIDLLALATASSRGSAACTTRCRRKSRTWRCQASHIGLGINPLAYLVIADRLAQDPGSWRPFEARGVPKALIRSSSA